MNRANGARRRARERIVRVGRAGDACGSVLATGEGAWLAVKAVLQAAPVRKASGIASYSQQSQLQKRNNRRPEQKADAAVETLPAEQSVQFVECEVENWPAAHVKQIVAELFAA